MWFLWPHKVSNSGSHRKFEVEDDGTKLFQDIFTLRWNRYVQRITRRYDEGFFCHFQRHRKQRKIWKTVRRREEKGKPELQNSLRNSNQRNKIKTWKPPRGSSNKGNQISYLSKYLINPEVKLETIDFGEGTVIETRVAEVSFKGLRRMLPMKLWVGPGVTAIVISKTAATIP